MHEVGIVMNSADGYQVLQSVSISQRVSIYKLGPGASQRLRPGCFNAGGRVKVEEVDKHSASGLTPRTRTN
jgi:hypothetical protein